MFLYGIGISTVASLSKGRRGDRSPFEHLLALAGVVAGLTVSLVLGKLIGVSLCQLGPVHWIDDKHSDIAGLRLMSWANKEPLIGYLWRIRSAWIGPILCFYFLTRR